MNLQWRKSTGTQALTEAFILSLREYKDVLSIESRHQVTREPTEIDELVIKKKPGAVVDNSIGRAFRQFNVIEYKSPDAELNIDVVWKAIGYAGLYKGYGETVNAIPYGIGNKLIPQIY